MKKIFALTLVFALASMLFACFGIGVASASVANTYYAGKNVTWIIPWAAGGTTDVMGRKLASLVEKKLGCTFVILNTNGGGGLVGFNTIIAAGKDGYTIGSVSPSMLLFKATGKADVSYDQADFLCTMATVPTVLVVPADSPYNTLDELIKYASANPGNLRYGNSGIGAIYHVIGESLARKAGVKFMAVPYNSGTEGATAAAGKHVEFAISGLAEATPLIDAGQLKPLCIFGTEHSGKFPDVKTTEELGYKGLLGSWTGVAMPSDCPPEAREALITALDEVITSDEWVKYLDTIGNIAKFMSGEEFASFLDEQNKAFAEIMADS